MNKKDNFLVAQFGRAVGLKGELKLNLHTDFPEQFIKGRVLKTDRGDLEIEHYNPKRGLIKIVGINTPEDAKKLTNAKIYSTLEESKKYCKLEENQFFWFDLINLSVFEDGMLLGIVKEIQRLPQCDYLQIETNKELVDKKMPKSFLIPYLPNFIKSVDLENKIIEVVNGKDILEAS